MADLKTYLDCVTNAQATVQQVVNEIDNAMQLGTKEGTEQALALESKLDEAIAERDRAEQFYNKIVNAVKTNDLLKNFVPVSETPATAEAEPPQNVMTPAQYRALAPSERLAFAKRGGTLQDS